MAEEIYTGEATFSRDEYEALVAYLRHRQKFTCVDKGYFMAWRDHQGHVHLDGYARRGQVLVPELRCPWR